MLIWGNGPVPRKAPPRESRHDLTEKAVSGIIRLNIHIVAQKWGEFNTSHPIVAQICIHTFCLGEVYKNTIARDPAEGTEQREKPLFFEKL